ncbi:hypothetical protein PAECIP111892_05196 [Paenibacillus auburnensis]|uniref:Heme-binding protein Shr-like Hb-interacting domain-containing protein n=1 Tax=Paenibacillus auburnensis TaxID=2905649 RepID=A0ABN8GZC4_9BACL|nr:Ig-like domain-containing protein [Paenibacillus auburnensis]CAH1222751.1 hypothetical protein PAECIP111892_05196 [Paenibacillus auburnensis]
MVGSNTKSKPGFMQTMSKMMAVIITATTVFTVSPGKSQATPLISPVTSATAEVGSSNTAITVSFNTYAIPATDLADLKSDIQIERSGSGSFVDLSADNAGNEINMNADGELVITLNTALTGSSNSINVAAGAVMNEEGVPSDADITVTHISALDITPPAYTGSTSNQGRSVYLSFDEDFTVNAPDGADEEQAQAFLADQLSVASDGKNFVPVTAQQASVYQNGSRQIYLNYDNNMKVILGTHTVIRIAAGTLKDAAGNLNEEINLQVSPPVIQSALVSGGNHDVTITFDKEVFDNSGDSLKNFIYLVKGTNDNWKGLVAQDTVSITSGKLTIHFAEALSGTDSQVVINRGALKDVYGNIQNDTQATALIEADASEIDPAPADTTAPKFLYYYLSKDKQELSFVFDENIFNATEDEASFLQNVQWYNPISYNWQYALPSDTVVTFTGKAVTLHFAAPLTGSQYYFQINPNHFQDAAGNVLTDYVNTNWLYPQQNSGITLNGGYFSHSGRYLSLQFNTNTALVDQTLADGVSHLNEYITISTDHGVTYQALDAQDVVYVHENSINIVFDEAKQSGSVRVKLAADAVSDVYDMIRNGEVDQEIAYNTPDITGYFFSNAASEFTYADNVAWREHVRVIRVYDNTTDVYRQLVSSEYSLSAGKLTFAKGVFQAGHEYEVMVDAEGYSSQYFEGYTYKSSEVFYMTAPAVTVDNGISASINLFNNAYRDYVMGNQTVIFELFDGSTPVSIVAANLKVNTGTYSASFNVSDADTNPNYTVKAYVVSKYSSDYTNLGLNLATVKTQLELDQAILNAETNKNNND